ncbi:MAG: toprim domain-containing protein, partial [Pseudomonadales bacterium]
AQHGIGYAVATLGTATSSAHMDLLFRYCSEVVFCFDGDAAGLGAARRALDTALAHMRDGRQIRFLFLPTGEDPDSLVRKEGTERFEERISQAMPLSEYIFQLASEGVDTSTPDGKAQFSKHAIAMIEKLPQGAFREIMQSEVSTYTGLKVQQVKALMPSPVELEDSEQTASEPTAVDFAPPLIEVDYFSMAPDSLEPVTGSRSPQELPQTGQSARHAGDRFHHQLETLSLSQAAITLLLHKPQLVGLITTELDSLIGLNDSDVRLFLELVGLAKKRPDANTGMLLGNWYGMPEYEQLVGLCGRGIELLREAADILSLSGGEPVGLEEGIEQQFLDAVQMLCYLPEEQRVQELLAKARAAQNGQATKLTVEEVRELERYWSERKS